MVFLSIHYCWWKKFCTNLEVCYPTLLDLFIPPGGSPLFNRISPVNGTIIVWRGLDNLGILRVVFKMYLHLWLPPSVDHCKIKLVVLGFKIKGLTTLASSILDIWVRGWFPTFSNFTTPKFQLSKTICFQIIPTFSIFTWDLTWSNLTWYVFLDWSVVQPRKFCSGVDALDRLPVLPMYRNASKEVGV